MNAPGPRFSSPVVRKHYTLSAPCRAKQARRTRNVIAHEANGPSHQGLPPRLTPKAGFFSHRMCQKSYENEKHSDP